jgi:hypothetical protein
MELNKAWIIFPLFLIILSATTVYSASYLKPGSAYYGDTDHPELDYSEMYANSTFAKNISTIDLSPVDTDMNNIQFLGIDMPNVFSPARDVYTMLKAGFNVPIIIGNAVGIEESLVELIVGIIGLLSLLGFLFFMRGTV